MLKKKKRAAEGGNLIVTNSSPSIVSEQFRTLRSNVNFSSSKGEIQSLVITSAVRLEGKSTVAVNLAAVYAQEGKKVLLVDGNMRRPTAHLTFSVHANMGLSTFLTRKASFQDVVKQTFVEGLDLIPSGPLVPNPSELLGSELMEALMHHVKEAYDIIIFDSPPLLTFTDGQIIANKCDASLLVINSGETDEEHVLQAEETLSLADGKLIGVILNNFNVSKISMKHQY